MKYYLYMTNFLEFCDFSPIGKGQGCCRKFNYIEADSNEAAMIEAIKIKNAEGIKNIDNMFFVQVSSVLTNELKEAMLKDESALAEEKRISDENIERAEYERLRLKYGDISGDIKL